MNTYIANAQQEPSVAAFPNGKFVVAWESNGQDGSSYGVYAQRYNAAGTAVGAEFKVNTYTTNNQMNPSVATFLDEGFVVAWESWNQDGSGDGVYAQRYDAAGTAVGAEFRVNTYTASNQWSPSVAAFPNGGFVVVWESNGQDGSDNGVYAQRYEGGCHPGYQCLDPNEICRLPGYFGKIVTGIAIVAGTGIVGACVLFPRARHMVKYATETLRDIHVVRASHAAALQEAQRTKTEIELTLQRVRVEAEEEKARCEITVEQHFTEVEVRHAASLQEAQRERDVARANHAAALQEAQRVLVEAEEEKARCEITAEQHFTEVEVRHAAVLQEAQRERDAARTRLKAAVKGKERADSETVAFAMPRQRRVPIGDEMLSEIFSPTLKSPETKMSESQGKVGDALCCLGKVPKSTGDTSSWQEKEVISNLQTMAAPSLASAAVSTDDQQELEATLAMPSLSSASHSSLVLCTTSSSFSSLTHSSSSSSSSGPRGTILRAPSPIEGFLSYERPAMNFLLQLRLPTASIIPANCKVLDTVQGLKSSMESVAYSTSISPVLWPILVKDGQIYHWIGMVFDSTGVKVIDSDNSHLASAIVLAWRSTPIEALPVMQQQYNNCGPEVIENFVLYLTGSRAPQNVAVPLHSLLWQNSLLNPATSAPQIAENLKFIGILSNSAPVPISYEPTLARQSWALVEYGPLMHKSPGSWYFEGKVNNAIRKAVINHLYQAELSEVNQVLERYPQLSDLRDRHPATWTKKYWNLAMKSTHPDKRGTISDFIAIKDLRDKNEALCANAFHRLANYLQPKLRSTTFVLKAVDFGFDAARAYNQPTSVNIKAVVIDALHMWSMYSGFGIFSVGASLVSAGYAYYEDGLLPALYSLSTSAAYMVLPGIALAGVSPCLTLAYTAFMAMFTGYHAVTNVYFFFYSREVHSYVAYKDFSKWLAEKPGFQAFESKTKEYELKINDIQAEIEHHATETNLLSEQGEFGAKIYQHIYAPVITAKHDLQQSVIEGLIPQEAADQTLNTQLVSIKDTSYNLCSSETDQDYYCSHKEQEIHHVKIVGSTLQVIEIL